jgi:N-acetylmuramoyl-L-alanine amidase
MNKYKVIIDPGHGDTDPGAIGINNIYEKDITLEISLLISDYLRKKNIQVEFTRKSDINIDLTNRVENINTNYSDFDICISIHCNAFTNCEINGIETYFGTNNKKLVYDNFLLSKYIQNSICNNVDYFKNRGVKKNKSLYLINNLHIPSCIIELGFITNFNDYKVLSSKTKKNKLAELISDGIIKYLNK